MQCPFCAETIQDAAILCRYCGATRQDGQWQAPALARAETAQAAAPASAPGAFTLRTAGFLFLVSAGFELLSLGTTVPLFGEMRGGGVAMGYHLLFATVFVLMGFGLRRAAPWGYQMVMAGTGLYLVDRTLFLFDGSARTAYVAEQTLKYQQIGGLIDVQPIIQLATQLAVPVALTAMACWLGFAVYVHYRRAYFAIA